MKIKLFSFLFIISFNAFALEDTPTEDFIDNKDGTVFHKKTSLIWQRCTVGQTWNGSVCTGNTTNMTWNEATAEYVTGKTCNDWRLPRIDELYTITKHSSNKPSLNTDIFSYPNNMGSESYFWSASPEANSSDFVWVVNFFHGYDNYNQKTSHNAVRLVKGGQFCSFESMMTPNTDFVDNKDGTVTHKKTGLMWQRCAIGQKWNGSTCLGNATKVTDSQVTNHTQAVGQNAQFAGHSDWRLPTQNELKTIVEYGASNPSINNTIFPNTPADMFLSSTPNASFTGHTWIVNFNHGYDHYDGKDSNVATRLVRGEYILFKP